MNKRKANDETDRGSASDNPAGEATPAKRRRSGDDKNLFFKTKVQNVLENLSDSVPGPLAVSGRLDAPMISIAVKNSKTVFMFPLQNAAQLTQLIERSSYGKVQATSGKAEVAALRNSWELYSGGFEILNPAWNNFVNNELAAKIKEEMFIEFSFVPSLYKLSLNGAGAFFQPHTTKMIDGHFATLAIQLPSLCEGGKLIIHHDDGNRTVISDSSSTRSSNMGTYFTAFYHHITPGSERVTQGCRVSLVYNLICRTPVIPTAPRRNPFELDLANLIKNWNQPGKLVYALQHPVSDLSYDNLKGKDRSIAKHLIYIARENDLNVCLAILKKESSGKCYTPRFDFDSDDEEAANWKSYSLSKLTAVDGTQMSTSSSSWTVNFEAEVIPENCFENINPYDRKTKSRGNGGADVTRFHSSAAIVFWPKQFFLDVPRKSGASVEDLDKIFLNEVELYRRRKVNDETVQAKLKHWAEDLISSGDGHKSIEFFKAIVEMKSIPLIQSLFSCRNNSKAILQLLPGVILNEASLPLVIVVCDTYGWKTFADQLIKMFEQMKNANGIELLGQICTLKMDEDKKNIVEKSLEAILEECIFSRKSPAEEQELLLSACRLAEKMNIQMPEIWKSKSMQLMVPVLLRLVPGSSETVTAFWMDVTQHFLREMVQAAAKPVHSWRRNDRTNCSCKDCIPVNIFLGSDQEEISFKMGKERRRHVRDEITKRRMQQVSHGEYRGSHIGTLYIRKTSPSRPEEDAAKRNFSIVNLPNLRAILPH